VTLSSAASAACILDMQSPYLDSTSVDGGGAGRQGGREGGRERENGEGGGGGER
jgi:hypothetical protein